MIRPSTIRALPSLLLALPLALLCADSTRAQEGRPCPPVPWDGTWTNAGGLRRRLVQSDEHVQLRLAWPGRRRVNLSGSVPAGKTLRLEGELPRGPGFVQKLRGDPTELPGEVRLVAELTPTFVGQGRWRMAVTLREDGRPIGQERWTHQAPWLELLEASPSQIDPTRPAASVKVKFRILGSEKLWLRLTVELDGDATAQDGRLQFYRTPVVATSPLTGAYELAPGTHTWAWDGRDSTSAQRKLMAGDYTIAVEALAVAGRKPRSRDGLRIEAPLRYGRPRLTYWGPVWNDLDPQPGFRASQQALGANSGYDLRHSRSPSFAGLALALRRSAVVMVSTHGTERGLVRPLPDQRLALLTSAGLAGLLTPAGATPPGQRPPPPLRDVRVVVLFACLVGRPERLRRPASANLPRRLVDLGVDCVVSMNSGVLIAAHLPWQQLLARRLLAGDDLRSASRKAAVEADKLSWDTKPVTERLDLRRAGGRPLYEALTFTQGGTTEVSKLTLKQAIWGDASQ